MKYLIRAVKYFFYICILLTVVLLILMGTGFVETDIDELFKNGYKSLLQIAGMFAVVSAFYPLFGYSKQNAIVPGEYSEIRQTAVSFMEGRGYVLEKEEGENLYFRQRSLAKRFFRTWEDRVSFERSVSGWTLEGFRRDVVSLVFGLENAARKEEE